jgi:hypothetical protein
VPSKRAVIREYEQRDRDPVVWLSLRAWTPVFASLEQALGHEIFERQRETEKRDVTKLTNRASIRCVP